MRGHYIHLNALLEQCRVGAHGERDITVTKLYNITKYIKYTRLNRLSRAGHVMRMENSRTGKKVLDTRPEVTWETHM
jgi:hypothetical protein